MFVRVDRLEQREQLTASSPIRRKAFAVNDGRRNHCALTDGRTHFVALKAPAFGYCMRSGLLRANVREVDRKLLGASVGNSPQSVIFEGEVS